MQENMHALKKFFSGWEKTKFLPGFHRLAMASAKTKPIEFN